MKYIKLLILFFLLVFPLIQLVASENIVNQLKVGGNIVMIRHAYCPHLPPEKQDQQPIYLEAPFYALIYLSDIFYNSYKHK